MKVIWLTQAVKLLESIYDFYAKVDPKFATRVIKTIFEDTNILKRFPLIAPLEPYYEGRDKYKKTIRSLIVMNGRFKVLYHIDSETIVIFAVIDCRQDISKIHIEH